jgi:hypothetical protein
MCHRAVLSVVVVGKGQLWDRIIMIVVVVFVVIIMVITASEAHVRLYRSSVTMCVCVCVEVEVELPCWTRSCCRMSCACVWKTRPPPLAHGHGGREDHCAG